MSAECRQAEALGTKRTRHEDHHSPKHSSRAESQARLRSEATPEAELPGVPTAFMSGTGTFLRVSEASMEQARALFQDADL
mmetsp:Transcript_49717/g.124974  ORF Transcript_49717/g.124974 Transcript_49717/m.124974 type:complete len:81 (-) Transcript_49717:2-244(-)